MFAFHVPTSIPHSSAFLKVLTTSAFFSNDFEGIHPQFRQTPPIPPFPVPSSTSTHATERPNFAPLIAAW